MLQTVRVLSKTFGEYKWQIALLVVLGFFGALLEGVGVNTVIPILSFLISSGEGSSNAITTAIIAVFNYLHIPFRFAPLVFLMVGLFIGRAIVLMLFSLVRARAKAEFVNRTIGDMFSATLNARWSFLLKQKMGHLHNTIVRDVQNVGSLFHVTVQFIQSFTGFLMYLVVAINISPKITFFTLGAGIVLVFIFRPLVKKSENIGRETGIVEKQLSQHVNEHVIGLKAVKSAGVENAVFRKAAHFLDLLKSWEFKNVFVSSLGRTFIQPFGFIFILVVFAFAYKSPGFNLAAFAATLYLIQKIFVYLESGQGTLHSISEFIPYAKHVLAFREELRKEEEHTASGHADFSFKESIDFKNVSFHYGKDGKGVISDFNLVIKKGHTVGLIGQSGAGKTSVADLLLRLFEPVRGAIEIDGVSIKDIDLVQWRERIGYVSQDIFLLNESIADNIKFYSDVQHEDMVKAAKQAHIFDFISSLPNGFETVVGDRGVMLSAGQRQRIVLARVMLRRPEILILDEATSALDNESELAIQKAIGELHGEMTVLVIAHRLSTVVDVDWLVALEHGRVIEEGEPRELLKNEQSYFYKNYHLK